MVDLTDFSTLPTQFIVLSAVTGGVVVLYLFYTSRVLGFVVSALLNSFFVGKEETIHVGSCHVGVIGGKLLLRDVRYASPDFAVRVVDGAITVRWWIIGRSEERLAVEDLGKPAIDRRQRRTRKDVSRLQVRLNGLQLQLFNNSAAYKRIEDLLMHQRGAAGTVSVAADGGAGSDVTRDRKDDEAQTPLLYRMFPVIWFDVNRLACVIGNSALQHRFRLFIHRIHGVHTLGPGTNRIDPYRLYVDSDIMGLRAYLEEWKDRDAASTLDEFRKGLATSSRFRRRQIKKQKHKEEALQHLHQHRDGTAHLHDGDSSAHSKRSHRQRDAHQGPGGSRRDAEPDSFAGTSRSAQHADGYGSSSNAPLLHDAAAASQRGSAIPGVAGEGSAHAGRHGVHTRNRSESMTAGVRARAKHFVARVKRAFEKEDVEGIESEDSYSSDDSGDDSRGPLRSIAASVRGRSQKGRRARRSDDRDDGVEMAAVSSGHIDEGRPSHEFLRSSRDYFSGHGTTLDEEDGESATDDSVDDEWPADGALTSGIHASEHGRAGASAAAGAGPRSGRAASARHDESGSQGDQRRRSGRSSRKQKYAEQNVKPVLVLETCHALVLWDYAALVAQEEAPHDGRSDRHSRWAVRPRLRRHAREAARKARKHRSVPSSGAASSHAWPIVRIELQLGGGHAVYGPAYDRIRRTLQSFYLPFDFQKYPIFQSRPGEYRPFDGLSINLLFKEPFKVHIPFHSTVVGLNGAAGERQTNGAAAASEAGAQPPSASSAPLSASSAGESTGSSTRSGWMWGAFGSAGGGSGGGGNAGSERVLNEPRAHVLHGEARSSAPHSSGAAAALHGDTGGDDAIGGDDEEAAFEVLQARDRAVLRTASASGHLEFRIGAESTTTMFIQWLALDESPLMYSISASIERPSLLTHAATFPLMKCEHMDVMLSLEFPLVWNAEREWKFQISLCNGGWEYLSLHDELISNVIDDWTQRVPDDPLPGSFESFVPMVYSYSLSMQDFEICMSCNRFNVVHKGNAPASNARLAIRADTISVGLQTPFREFRAATTRIAAQATASAFELVLVPAQRSAVAKCLPMHEVHVIEAADFDFALTYQYPNEDTGVPHGSDDSSSASDSDSEGSARAVLSPGGRDRASLRLPDASALPSSPSKLTFIDVRVQASPVRILLSGYNVRYVMQWFDNYYGDTQECVSAEQFRERRRAEMARAAGIASPRSGADSRAAALVSSPTLALVEDTAPVVSMAPRVSQTYVTVVLESVECELPTQPISARDTTAPQLRTQRVALEVLSAPEALDLRTDVEPVTVRFMQDGSQHSSVSVYGGSYLLRNHYGTEKFATETMVDVGPVSLVLCPADVGTLVDVLRSFLCTHGTDDDTYHARLVSGYEIPEDISPYALKELQARVAHASCCVLGPDERSVLELTLPQGAEAQASSLAGTSSISRFVVDPVPISLSMKLSDRHRPVWKESMSMNLSPSLVFAQSTARMGAFAAAQLGFLVEQDVHGRFRHLTSLLEEVVMTARGSGGGESVAPSRPQSAHPSGMWRVRRHTSRSSTDRSAPFGRAAAQRVHSDSMSSDPGESLTDDASSSPGVADAQGVPPDVQEGRVSRSMSVSSAGTAYESATDGLSASEGSESPLGAAAGSREASGPATLSGWDSDTETSQSSLTAHSPMDASPPGSFVGSDGGEISGLPIENDESIDLDVNIDIDDAAAPSAGGDAARQSGGASAEPSRASAAPPPPVSRLTRRLENIRGSFRALRSGQRVGAGDESMESILRVASGAWRNADRGARDSDDEGGSGSDIGGESDSERPGTRAGARSAQDRGGGSRLDAYGARRSNVGDVGEHISAADAAANGSTSEAFAESSAFSRPPPHGAEGSKRGPRRYDGAHEFSTCANGVGNVTAHLEGFDSYLPYGHGAFQELRGRSMSSASARNAVSKRRKSSYYLPMQFLARELSSTPSRESMRSSSLTNEESVISEQALDKLTAFSVLWTALEAYQANESDGFVLGREHRAGTTAEDATNAEQSSDDDGDGSDGTDTALDARDVLLIDLPSSVRVSASLRAVHIVVSWALNIVDRLQATPEQVLLNLWDPAFEKASGELVMDPVWSTDTVERMAVAAAASRESARLLEYAAEGAALVGLGAAGESADVPTAHFGAGLPDAPSSASLHPSAALRHGSPPNASKSRQGLPNRPSSMHDIRAMRRNTSMGVLAESQVWALDWAFAAKRVSVALVGEGVASARAPPVLVRVDVAQLHGAQRAQFAPPATWSRRFVHFDVREAAVSFERLDRTHASLSQLVLHYGPHGGGSVSSTGLPDAVLPRGIVQRRERSIVVACASLSGARVTVARESDPDEGRDVVVRGSCREVTKLVDTSRAGGTGCAAAVDALSRTLGALAARAKRQRRESLRRSLSVLHATEASDTSLYARSSALSGDTAGSRSGASRLPRYAALGKLGALEGDDGNDALLAHLAARGGHLRPPVAEYLRSANVMSRFVSLAMADVFGRTRLEQALGSDRLVDLLATHDNEIPRLPVNVDVSVSLPWLCLRGFNAESAALTGMGGAAAGGDDAAAGEAATASEANGDSVHASGTSSRVRPTRRTDQRLFSLRGVRLTVKQSSVIGAVKPDEHVDRPPAFIDAAPHLCRAHDILGHASVARVSVGARLSDVSGMAAFVHTIRELESARMARASRTPQGPGSSSNATGLPREGATDREQRGEPAGRPAPHHGHGKPRAALLGADMTPREISAAMARPRRHRRSLSHSVPTVVATDVANESHRAFSDGDGSHSDSDDGAREDEPSRMSSTARGKALAMSEPRPRGRARTEFSSTPMVQRTTHGIGTVSRARSALSAATLEDAFSGLHTKEIPALARPEGSSAGARTGPSSERSRRVRDARARNRRQTLSAAVDLPAELAGRAHGGSARSRGSGKVGESPMARFDSQRILMVPVQVDHRYNVMVTGHVEEIALIVKGQSARVRLRLRGGQGSYAGRWTAKDGSLEAAMAAAVASTPATAFATSTGVPVDSSRGGGGGGEVPSYSSGAESAAAPSGPSRGSADDSGSHGTGSGTDGDGADSRTGAAGGEKARSSVGAGPQRGSGGEKPHDKKRFRAHWRSHKGAHSRGYPAGSGVGSDGDSGSHEGAESGETSDHSTSSRASPGADAAVQESSQRGDGNAGVPSDSGRTADASAWTARAASARERLRPHSARVGADGTARVRDALRVGSRFGHSGFVSIPHAQLEVHVGRLRAEVVDARLNGIRLHIMRAEAVPGKARAVSRILLDVDGAACAAPLFRLDPVGIDAVREELTRTIATISLSESAVLPARLPPMRERERARRGDATGEHLSGDDDRSVLDSLAQLLGPRHVARVDVRIRSMETHALPMAHHVIRFALEALRFGGGVRSDMTAGDAYAKTGTLRIAYAERSATPLLASSVAGAFEGPPSHLQCPLLSSASSSEAEGAAESVDGANGHDADRPRTRRTRALSAARASSWSNEVDLPPLSAQVTASRFRDAKRPLTDSPHAPVAVQCIVHIAPVNVSLSPELLNHLINLQSRLLDDAGRFLRLSRPVTRRSARDSGTSHEAAGARAHSRNARHTRGGASSGRQGLAHRPQSPRPLRTASSHERRTRFVIEKLAASLKIAALRVRVKSDVVCAEGALPGGLLVEATRCRSGACSPAAAPASETRWSLEVVPALLRVLTPLGPADWFALLHAEASLRARACMHGVGDSSAILGAPESSVETALRVRSNLDDRFSSVAAGEDEDRGGAAQGDDGPADEVAVQIEDMSLRMHPGALLRINTLITDYELMFREYKRRRAALLAKAARAGTSLPFAGARAQPAERDADRSAAGNRALPPLETSAPVFRPAVYSIRMFNTRIALLPSLLTLFGDTSECDGLFVSINDIVARCDRSAEESAVRRPTGAQAGTSTARATRRRNMLPSHAHHGDPHDVLRLTAAVHDVICSVGANVVADDPCLRSVRHVRSDRLVLRSVTGAGSARRILRRGRVLQVRAGGIVQADRATIALSPHGCAFAVALLTEWQSTDETFAFLESRREAAESSARRGPAAVDDESVHEGASASDTEGEVASALHASQPHPWGAGAGRAATHSGGSSGSAPDSGANERRSPPPLWLQIRVDVPGARVSLRTHTPEELAGDGADFVLPSFTLCHAEGSRSSVAFGPSIPPTTRVHIHAAEAPITLPISIVTFAHQCSDAAAQLAEKRHRAESEYIVEPRRRRESDVEGSAAASRDGSSAREQYAHARSDNYDGEHPAAVHEHSLSARRSSDDGDHVRAFGEGEYHDHDGSLRVTGGPAPKPVLQRVVLFSSSALDVALSSSPASDALLQVSLGAVSALVSSSSEDDIVRGFMCQRVHSGLFRVGPTVVAVSHEMAEDSCARLDIPSTVAALSVAGDYTTLLSTIDGGIEAQYSVRLMEDWYLLWCACVGAWHMGATGTPVSAAAGARRSRSGAFYRAASASPPVEIELPSDGAADPVDDAAEHGGSEQLASVGPLGGARPWWARDGAVFARVVVRDGVGVRADLDDPGGIADLRLKRLSAGASAPGAALADDQGIAYPFVTLLWWDGGALSLSEGRVTGTIAIGDALVEVVRAPSAPRPHGSLAAAGDAAHAREGASVSAPREHGGSSSVRVQAPSVQGVLAFDSEPICDINVRPAALSFESRPGRTAFGALHVEGIASIPGCDVSLTTETVQALQARWEGVRARALEWRRDALDSLGGAWANAYNEAVTARAAAEDAQPRARASRAGGARAPLGLISLPDGSDVVVGEVVVSVSESITVSLHEKFGVRSERCARLELESFVANLKQKVQLAKSNDTAVRAGGVSEGRPEIRRLCTMQISSTRALRVSGTKRTPIIQVPGTMVEMYTLQPTGTLDVHSFFVTEFADAIMVSLNMSLYSYLRSIVAAYAAAFGAEGSARTASPPLLQEQPQPQRQRAQGKPELRYQKHAMTFAPRLSVLGDATPRIERVLSWLGVERPDEYESLIPAATHEHVTLTLEKALRLFSRVCEALEAFDTHATS